jgi:hypothetical protein
MTLKMKVNEGGLGNIITRTIDRATNSTDSKINDTSLHNRNDKTLEQNILIKYNVCKTLKSKRSTLLTEAGLSEYIKINKTGYENLKSVNVKSYFDFDIKYSSEQEQLAKHQQDILTVVNDVELFLSTQYVKLEKNTGIRVLCSSGYSKNKKTWINSFHVINDSFIWTCGANLKQEIVRHGEWTYQPDLAVYSQRDKRQLFRLPFCSKEGEDRPFKPMTQDHDDDWTYATDNQQITLYMVSTNKDVSILADHGYVKVEDKIKTAENPKLTPETPVDIEKRYFKYLKKKIPTEADSMTVRNTKMNGGTVIINLDRIKPSMCLFCDRIHDSDNTGVIIIFKGGNAFYSCIKKTKEKPMINIHMTPKPTKTLKDTLADCVNQFETINDVDSFNKYGYKLIKTNKKHCANIPEFMDLQNGITAIKAQMGTGKTYGNARMVEQLIIANPNIKICVISMRITLASKYKEDYNGFVCYLDNDEVLTQNKLICQLDSMNRIRWSETTDSPFCDLVVIDECEGALSHLTSKTYMNHPLSNVNVAKFKQFMRYSTKVVLMDANLTPETVKIIDDIRDDKQKPIVIINEYQPPRQTVKITDEMSDIISIVKANLDNGLKSYIPVNRSKKKIFAIADLLKKHNPRVKILVICADTLNQTAVIEAMENPNLQWGLYDVVICSPSVQGGISYDVINQFHGVYAIFGNMTNSSSDACQMIRRIRHATDKTLYVCFNGNYSNKAGDDITNKSDYVNFMSTTRGMNHGINRLIDSTEYEYNQYDIVEFKQSWIFNLYVDYRVKQNKDRMNWISNFMIHQLSYGNKIEIMTATPDTQIYTELGLCEVERDKADCIKLANADDITNDKFDELKEIIKKGKASDDEKLMYSRKFINTWYGMNNIRNPDWYRVYNDETMKTQYNNLKPFAVSKDITLTEVLDNMKLKEQRAEANRRQKPTTTGDYIPTETETAIMKSLSENDRYKFVKTELLVNMLMMIGFDSLFSDNEITVDDMKLKLTNVHNMYFTDCQYVCDTLGKAKHKLKPIERLKPTDKNFVKSLLGFINGSLDTWYGVKVEKISKNYQKYKLCNDNVVNGIFKYPHRQENIECEFGDNTPCLYVDESVVGEIDATDADINGAMVRLGLC